MITGFILPLASQSTVRHCLLIIEVACVFLYSGILSHFLDNSIVSFQQCRHRNSDHDILYPLSSASCLQPSGTSGKDPRTTKVVICISPLITRTLALLQKMSSQSTSEPKPPMQPEANPQKSAGTLIPSTDTHDPALGDGRAYRNWTFAKVMASSSVDAAPTPVTLDTGAMVSIVERTFLQAQAPDTPIR